MKNKKTIIYVDRENELQTCRNFLGSNPGEDIRCIVANSASKERLESWEIPCTPIVRYQVLQEQVEALPIAINLAGKWFYNSAGNDLTKFKGISLGGAMKYLVHLMLKYAIKAINNVNHILDQEQPDRIVLVENTNVEGHPPLFLDFDFYKIVFKWFAIQKGFEIKYLPIQNGGENSSYKNPWLEWQSLRLPGPVQNLSIFLPNPIISFSKSLFVNLVDGFKMFPFLNPNLDSGRIRALVLSATDLTYLGKFLIDQILKTKPNSIFYLEGEGNSYLNLRIRHANEPPSINLKGDPELSQFILKLDQVLETLKVNLNDNPQMKHRGVPLFSLSPQFFERIVCQEIANLAIFLVKANKAISNYKTNLILTTNHLMPKTVVLSQLASQKKIPSINIYHGHCYGFIDPHGKNFLNHQLVPRNFPS